MPGFTPFRKIPFPLAGETISAADIRAMGAAMDTSLMTSQQLSALAQSRSSLSSTFGSSVVKNTDTYMALNSASGWDTGAHGPGATALWASGNPTRVTAPVTGLYLVGADVSASGWGSVNVTQFLRLILRKQGTTVVGGDQVAARGSQYPSPALKSLVVLTAGQYVEIGCRWGGPDAGPLSCSGDLYVALMAVQ